MGETKTRVIEITAVTPGGFWPDDCSQRECDAHATVRVDLSPDSWSCPTCGETEYYCDTHWAEFVEAVIQFNQKKEQTNERV